MKVIKGSSIHHLATFFPLPWIITDSPCTAPPGHAGSPCRGKGVCIWGSILHSWRGAVHVAGRTPGEVPKTLEGRGWFLSLSCHTAPPTWEMTQKSKDWTVKTNEEEKRNILVTRDHLERETENILWKRCSKQKEKEPREVVRARASERRRKKTHKRWLKDETGAQKKSRTLIDARRVMFEEDSRSPPTGLWCLRAPEIPSHVAENSVAASGERKINIHLSCDLTQCWI